VKQNFDMKDSGEREIHGENGAVRDIRTGKGRYDLISHIAMRRLAVVYEKGAAKYADRNWEKGMPLCRFFDSAKRHMDQWLAGETDEDHLGHAMWNLASMIHLGELRPDLDDRPKYIKLVDANIQDLARHITVHDELDELQRECDSVVDAHLEKIMPGNIETQDLSRQMLLHDEIERQNARLVEFYHLHRKIGSSPLKSTGVSEMAFKSTATAVAKEQDKSLPPVRMFGLHGIELFPRRCLMPEAGECRTCGGECIE
jgi:hypothetical protein